MRVLTTLGLANLESTLYLGEGLTPLADWEGRIWQARRGAAVPRRAARRGP